MTEISDTWETEAERQDQGLPGQLSKILFQKLKIKKAGDIVQGSLDSISSTPKINQLINQKTTQRLGESISK